MRVLVYVNHDDDIYYGCGDRYYVVRENFLEGLDEDHNKVHYYEKDNKFVIFNDEGKIFKIVFTQTCWSDDYIEYIIKDDKIVQYYERYHGGRRLTINYDENEKVKNYNYDSNNTFGIPPVIGEDAPELNIKEYYV